MGREKVFVYAWEGVKWGGRKAKEGLDAAWKWWKGDKKKKKKDEQSCVGRCKNSPETQKSVDEKLDKYLLNKDHDKGKDKAEFFDRALGFNKSNAGDLAKQIQFDPSKAVATELTQYGQKFNQIIPITGANGRVIDMNFAWIRNNDGIVRLVTGVPAK
jgi:filamentous hemagglutinin